MILEKLYKIIEDRKKTLPANSYVASLFEKGDDRLVQKVGEEALEVVIAAKNKAGKRIISEIADLWFHLLVLMVAKNISLEEVDRELKMRNK